MIINKDAIATKLLWMDLEFTDFDYLHNCVLEVSVEITDFNFKTLATYEARIKNDPQKLVQRFALNTFWQDYSNNQADFIKHNNQATDSQQVQAELVELVTKHFGAEPAILAGNSIHSDRQVIKAHWPQLDQRLHYRMLDVSSFKTLMAAKYGVVFGKASPHRAYEDVKASIAELQYYLEWFASQK